MAGSNFKKIQISKFQSTGDHYLCGLVASLLNHLDLVCVQNPDEESGWAKGKISPKYHKS